MRANPTPDLTPSEHRSARADYSTGIAALEAIVGRDAALAIINAFGGRDVLVRAIPFHDDDLSTVIGIDAAQAVADELLGDDDGEGRRFFINQPPMFTQVPGERTLPTLAPIAAPADAALRGTLSVIEEVCGRDAALKLVAHYGGGRLYVPHQKNLTEDSALAKVIGLEAAQALAEAFQGNGHLNIPPSVYGSSSVRRDTGMKMLRDGYTPADVIRLLKVSRSVVFEWSRKIKEEQK